MSVPAAPRARPPARFLISFRFWVVALALVVAVAWLSSPATTTAQRVTHLETLVKCPSCEDLSVAQSTSSSALAVRHEIVAMVGQGKSDTQIFTAIEAAYGPSILLSPSLAGLGALLWIVPSAVFVGLVISASIIRRRR